MKNIHRLIEHKTEKYVSDLQALFHSAVTDTVGELLQRPVRTRQRRAGAHRPEIEISALTEKLMTAISAAPGATMRDLAPRIGCTCRELSLSIRDLLFEQRVKKAGSRQYTRYFPMPPLRRHEKKKC